MVYGFCLKRTKYENLDAQAAQIKKKYPGAVIYKTEDSYQKDFDKLTDAVKDGDIVVVSDILKLCTEVLDKADIDTIFNTVYRNYSALFAKGADIIILSFPFLSSDIYRSAIVNNHVPGSNHVEMAASHILEGQIRMAIRHQINRNNTKAASIKSSLKESGKRIGNPKGIKLNIKKERSSKEFMKDNLIDFGGKLSNDEVMAQLGIARNTFFKYKKELKMALESTSNLNDTIIDTDAADVITSETVSTDTTFDTAPESLSVNHPHYKSAFPSEKMESKPVLSDDENTGEIQENTKENEPVATAPSVENRKVNGKKKDTDDRDMIDGQTTLFDFL